MANLSSPLGYGRRYPFILTMPKFVLVHWFVVVAIVAIACGLLLPMIRSAQEATHVMTCRNNLKQIGLALANYEASFRSLPIAAEVASDGKLWRSWRSQVYPVYMEQTSMFYDGSSSWDSKANMRLLNGTPIAVFSKGGKKRMVTLDRYPWCFTCPSHWPKLIKKASTTWLSPES